MTTEQIFRAAISAVNNIAAFEAAIAQNQKLEANAIAKIKELWPAIPVEHQNLLEANASAIGLNLREIFAKLP